MKLRIFFLPAKRSAVGFMTLLFLLTTYGTGFSQNNGSSDMVTIGLLLILVVLVIGAVAVASSNLVQVAALSKNSTYQKDYSDEKGELETRHHHVIKKGMNILIKGESDDQVSEIHTSRYAIQP